MLSVTTILEMLNLRGASSGQLKSLNTLKSSTALGVSISEKQINLVLLKKGKKGIELLKSVTCPVPDGAVKNGNIEDAAVLARAIRKLKKSSRIRTTRAAVLLFARPVVTQIISLPKQVPSNVTQFVQEQVKDFAVLPGRKIALDYCGVGGVGSDVGSTGRLFITATDDRKVEEIVEVCGQADIAVEAIEPSLLAYTRALYARNIAGKFDCNVLIAVLQDNTLTLCVFRKQTMDFVRTISISRENAQSNQFCQWLTEQINKVIQFYDVDVPDSCGKWEITVVVDDEQLPENAEAVLKTKFASSNLQVLTGEDICHAAVVSQSADCKRADKSSLVALGLAMKLLDTDTHNLGLNLLPPEVGRLRTVQKGTLITANIMAAMMLIMVLAVNGSSWRLKGLSENIDHKSTALLQGTCALIRENTSVDKEINSINDKLNQINNVLSSNHNTDLSGLLKDIGKGIPRNICITSLSSGAKFGMSLKGLAKSNGAVYSFAEILNNSEHIDSASVAKIDKDSRGFLSYEINCVLTPEKGI